MRVTEIPIHPSATRVATGQTAGFSNPGVEGVMVIDVSAIAGTPTLDVTIEAQDPISGLWNATGDAFAQLTAVGRERIELPFLPDHIIRAVYTIGGGTPSLTFSIMIIMKEPR